VLEKRLMVLEQQAKASRAKAVPFAPLTAATSTGGGVAGIGVSQDAASRAAQTAIQAGLTSGSSIEDIITAPVTVNFGGGAVQNLYQTNYLRPDPIVGDTYRVTAGGFVTNNSGGNAQVTFTWSMAAGGGFKGFGNTGLFATGNFVCWWALLYATITTAGTAGAWLTNFRGSFGAPNIAIGLNAVALDNINSDNTPTGNLVTPAPTIQVQSTVVAATVSVTLHQYSLERVGSNPFNKV